MSEIPEERELTSQERDLIRWLLEHGRGEALSYLSQLDRIRVISKCCCGCASINLDLDGRGWSSKGGMDILSDYEWQDAEGRLFGIYVFAKDDTLAGLDVWSVDGLATPTSLPDSSVLAPIQ